ncbi:hypothetical protein DPMN_153259 [Dreissena polymorpha]|uniref:Uncharacterized protein n=1 Tax=Dreissena polymorpha TaxID=45954 RepID=A0A9D4FLZ5_DREPO|nr:hypothetical protein DPMN_153259 [Dreissena polymorpha]
MDCSFITKMLFKLIYLLKCSNWKTDGSCIVSSSVADLAKSRCSIRFISLFSSLIVSNTVKICVTASEDRVKTTVPKIMLTIIYITAGSYIIISDVCRYNSSGPDLSQQLLYS